MAISDCKSILHSNGAHTRQLTKLEFIVCIRFIAQYSHTND